MYSIVFFNFVNVYTIVIVCTRASLIFFSLRVLRVSFASGCAEVKIWIRRWIFVKFVKFLVPGSDSEVEN